MLFLHQLTFSTKIIICRKTNIFIFNALSNKDTCRTSNRGVYMYYVEKNFFGYVFGRSLSGRAIQGFRPHRSSTLQVRPSLAMLQNGFGQPCSLPIPNAEKRLPALLPGHLSSAWCCQTERNTCRLSHGCTPFRCGVGLRRYGLRCLLALHRVPR